MSFQSISPSTAWFASTSSAQASQRWRSIGTGSGSWRSPISCWRWFRHMSSSAGGGWRMAKAKYVVVAVLVVAAAAGGLYVLRGSQAAAPIIGVVRTTEIRVAPEVGGQLAAIKVAPGARVRAGDVMAE